MISTHKRNVTELMQDLTQWVSTAPHIVVEGVQLVAEDHCSVKLSELGDSKCVVNQDQLSQNAKASDPPIAIVVGVAATVVLVALIVLTACGILVLRRKWT